jgi:uncharacterized protein
MAAPRRTHERIGGPLGSVAVDLGRARPHVAHLEHDPVRAEREPHDVWQARRHVGVAGDDELAHESSLLHRRYRPGPMYVLALEVELRIVDAHSLKDKRQVVKSLVETVRRRFAISAAEVGRQENWQRATLGFAVVASSAGQATAVIDDVDRFVWSHPAVEVIEAERSWLA